jgi:cytochrome P450
MTEAPVLPMHMRRTGLNPAEELARARDDDGVVRVTMPDGIPIYLVCRYEDARRVLSDSTRFSSVLDVGEDEQAQRMRAGKLIVHDPPEHTRLRRMLTPEFTMRRMRRLEPRIVEIVEAALDDLERAGKPADLISHFALPVSLLVICELLGVPYADRAEFEERTTRVLDVSLPARQRIAGRQQIRDYMAGLVARAWAERGEDILGMLVREHGDELSVDELSGIASLLLAAGHETTSNMLGLGALALLRHPDQLAMVRDDPASSEPATEELLRWLAVIQSVPRTTTTDVEVAGHTIPANSLVGVSLPAANRDRAFIENPDTLDITRGTLGHLAFGHGVHHCVGAPLARMEMRIAFPALLRRFPNLALAEPFSDVQFRTFHFIYGLKSLEVTWR